MKYLISGLLACLMLVQFLSAQSQDRAYLETALQNTPESQQRVDLLNRLGDLLYEADAPTAEKYAEESLKLARKLSYKQGTGEALVVQGISHLRQNRLGKGIKSLEDALNYISQQSDPIRRMKIYEQLAFAYELQGNGKQAQVYKQQYLSLRDEYVTNRNKQKIAELQQQYELERQAADAARSSAGQVQQEKDQALQILKKQGSALQKQEFALELQAMTIEQREAALLRKELELSRMQEEQFQLELEKSEHEQANLRLALDLREEQSRRNWLGGGLVVALLVSLVIWLRFRVLQARKLAELEAQRAERLQQVDRIKDQFLANTSHELRTPLNGIIGISEALQDQAHNDFERDNLALIVSSGKRLASLVSDLLDFSRLRNRDLMIQSKAVDLRTLTDVVLQTMHPLLGEKDLSLENSIPTHFPRVKADENRLQQIFYNLVGNAIKFTYEGRIVVQAAEKEGWIEVSVSDTGIGIPKDRQEQIFEAFEQLDGSATREYGGTGLGLSITRRLVELHGGSMRVESAPGEGSAFYFTLPKAEETEESAPALEAARQTPARQFSFASQYDPIRTQAYVSPIAGAIAEVVDDFSGERIRVLVVDDEPINQQVLKNHLLGRNIEVVSAMNGPDALAILERGEKFDIVLLDIMMPRMSGYEVCHKIRENHLPSELPVIMVTAKDQVADLVQGLNTGANDYLAKPFSKDEFLARMKTHLNLHRINKATGRFVPREFLKALGYDTITDVKLGDQVEREGTVLFCDIRGYTTLSEQMGPDDTFRFLNRYLGLMGPVIVQNGGFVSQFFGDGILALFLNDPQSAVVAARQMLEALQTYNRYRVQNGRIELSIGIGMHTGSIMMGMLGDAQRLDAGLVSDTVNTASRLEGLTKHFGAKVLISETTLKGLSTPDAFKLRFLGKVQVKGRRDAVGIYESLEGYSEEALQVKDKTAASFEAGLAAYYAREFEKAIGLFEQVLAISPEDRSTARYLNHCRRYLSQGLPEDWTGVEMMDEK